MKKKNFTQIAKTVIQTEINALQKLKNNLDDSFNKAVQAITKCKSKIILCGVGKSGLIASKISSTLSSVGCPSYSVSAMDCSHGDLGSINKSDLLILISNSGNSSELKNIINYANRYKIKLIGIVSKKNSILYKAANIKLLIPEVKEAGLGIVPTSSTTNQLAIGDALAVACLKQKNISYVDFKRFHPAGSLGIKLKTVEDFMLKGKQIPFVNENLNMKQALQIITKKKLGVLLVRNKKNLTSGIITDGQIRRINQRKENVHNLKVKSVMTKNPISIDKNTLATNALDLMNKKKITSLCVHSRNKIKKTIGFIHIHNVLENTSF